jgi:glycosyltransferase involved in cell wall biosynthesis
MNMEPPRVSIVVPLYNEEANLKPLVTAVRSALDDQVSWELLMVDDGSRDGTVAAAAAEVAQDHRVRLLQLARNYGQTTAMQAGFDHARGRVVVSMDGDLQNDPRDIPGLLEKLDEGYDLVAGYRVRRRDPLLTRKVPSWIANRIIRLITGVSIRDNGCSLKAYRRELLRGIELYSDQHRFIPAVAVGVAGARIAEVPVRHHARRAGASKYGLSRVFKVLADLVTITMIRWFRDSPLMMFAMGAAASAGLGLGFTAAAIVALATFSPVKANALVLPGSAFLLFGLAAYLIMLGLIAEVAVNRYETWPGKGSGRGLAQ